MTDFEREDLELAEVMGGKFKDITKEPETVTFAQVSIPTTNERKSAQRPAEKAMKVAEAPVDAGWKPERTRNWMDSLKACAKSTVIFGGLNLLIFYWHVEGLMAYSIALPCMLTCALLAGFGIGRAWRGSK